MYVIKWVEKRERKDMPYQTQLQSEKKRPRNSMQIHRQTDRLTWLANTKREKDGKHKEKQK